MALFDASPFFPSISLVKSCLFVVPFSLVVFVLVFSLCSRDSNVDLWLKWTLKRVIRSNYSVMVAEQRGFLARKREEEVGKPSAGASIKVQRLETDGLEKAVGCQRAMEQVTTGVEKKKKFKKKEQLGSLVKECVAKVEDELRKRNREFQPVAEAGKNFYLPLMDDGDKMDKDQVKENNEFVRVSTLEDQRNGNGDAGLRQREELGKVNVFEHEKLKEGNLEQIGNGSVGVCEVDQSVELKCAREGGQLVNRWKIESRRWFSGGEAGEIVRIQGSRSQDFGVDKGPEPKWNIEGSPQSSRVRQIWLKMDRKTRVGDLGEETGEKLKER